jgi:hypothetical protein
MTLISQENAFSASTKSFLKSSTVHISAQAKSDTEAKDQALKEGRKQATAKALTKAIIKPEDLDFLLNDIETIAGKFVESYTINNERISMIKYEADLTVNFYSKDLKKFLSAQNIDFIENIPLRFLIIPIETSFFNSSNGNIWSTKLWKQTWKKLKDINKNSINFQLAKGDFEDIANITSSNLLHQRNPNTINQILDKYKATTILTIEVMDINEETLGIRILDLDNYKSHEFSYNKIYDLTEEENYELAAQKAIDEIFKMAKTKNLDIKKQEVKTDLEFYIKSLRDKINIKKSLEGISGIKSFSEKKSSLRTVVFELSYNKAEEKEILEKLLSMKHSFMVISKEMNNDNQDLEEEAINEVPSSNENRDIEAERILEDIRGVNKLNEEKMKYFNEANEEKNLEKLMIPEKANYTF